MSRDVLAATAADHQWLERAETLCVSLARRLGPAYARRLRRQRLPFDGAADLVALAARRAVPLDRPAFRKLLRLAVPLNARAFAALVPADRDVLLASGNPREPARLDHAAAAIARLARNARAARRHGGDAPLGWNRPVEDD